MKRTLFAAGILIATLLGPAQAEIKPMQLRVAAVFPPPEVSMASYAIKLWMDEVTKQTDGKVTFRPFWGGALGRPPEHLNLVQSGAVDLALTTALYTPGVFPIHHFEYVLPFGPADALVVTKAKRDVINHFPQFREDLAKANIVPIMNPSGAAYQILSKQPVNSLEDFKGKKISLIGRYFGQWVGAAGSTPVVAPAADRYTMLQTGVVDMDLLPIDLFTAYKVYEQAPNYVEVDALLANYFDLWMNKAKFDALPPELQKILLDAGEKIELQVAQEVVPDWTKRIMSEFEQKGVKFQRLSPEERAKWADMVHDTAADWAKEVEEKGYPGSEIVQMYQDATAKYGYTWPRRWGAAK